MWCQTELTERLQIKLPIIQAGMAGGITTPQLVAAVSNAGGLGTLGAGYMTPAQIQSAIREIRSLTTRPFAVNLFIPKPASYTQQQIDQMNHFLQQYRNLLGIHNDPALSPYAPVFEEQLAVVLLEQVPVFSFTFGILAENYICQLRDNGIMIIGTATTVKEAILLERSGVDFIVAQGSEAGGHRGTFDAGDVEALIGTVALIPQMVDKVNVPVVAAGGIMDGRGIVAARSLGACGVQLGTAFLPCHESGTHPRHIAAILSSSDESTVVTKAFSGKPARGIYNHFISEMAKYPSHIPPYPVQNALTRDIRQAASQQNNTEYMSMWAGQAASLGVQIGAAELMGELVKQTERVLLALSK